MVAGLLMGALATGALITMAPAAQAAPYGNLKDCQIAAKRKADERISQGDLNVPNYTCKRDGNGWRIAVG
ncbi:hypothetical protein DFR71_0922 [Nocardia alba]|uniref:Uncharacterized protein n=2 Tax=Nocardia alba TaxID=225051 RepID=A0A4R1FWP2_9NOCA|nr:hypothetical protein DFR71_0922 [Nocardia alba]